MDPLLSHVLTGAVALVLGRACLHKARNRSHFANSLAAYEILPGEAHAAASLGLIVFEATVAVLLISQLFVPELRGFGGVGAVTLLTLYSIAISINLSRGRRDLDCGCDGPGKSRPISPTLLARNALLIAMAGLSALPLSPRPMLAIDVFSIVFALAAFSLLYETMNQLGQTARSPFSSDASQARSVS